MIYQQNIHFKILLLVCRTLNGSAPHYISDMLTDYTPIRPLRSSDSGFVVVPRIKSEADKGLGCSA